MADRFRQIPQKLLEIWNKWTKTQKIVIIGVAFAFIIGVVVVSMILSRTKYETLATCENYTEMNSITSMLTENGYKYKIENMTVQVDKKKLIDAKMLIASEDIQSDGYTFEDAMKSSFTTTESDKMKQYAHYLSTKFATDLSSMDGIKSATVNIDIPDSTNSFYEVASEASVGVCLTTTRDIGSDMAESIANFLATSIGNSSTKNINIIDDKGNTLFNGSSGANTVSGVGTNGKLKYKAQIEATTADGIKRSILSTGLYDDAILNLNYDLDWDAVNKIAKEYIAQEGREEGLFAESYRLNSTGTNGAAGTPGTVSNDGTTYDISDGTTSSSIYNVEQIQYLPNEIVTTTNSDPGSIVHANSTIAVSLIKQVLYDEEECQRLGYLEGIDWDTFKAQNTEPTVLEVDPTWTDFISKATGIDPENISIVAYQRPLFHDRVRANVWQTASFWVQIVLAVAILGILILVVIRSARPLTVEEKEPELSVEEMLASTKENQPSVDDIDLQDKSETRKAIEKFVDENPEAVALLLRNWLNDDWG